MKLTAINGHIDTIKEKWPEHMKWSDQWENWFIRLKINIFLDEQLHLQVCTGYKENTLNAYRDVKKGVGKTKDDRVSWKYVRDQKWLFERHSQQK